MLHRACMDLPTQLTCQYQPQEKAINNYNCKKDNTKNTNVTLWTKKPEKETMQSTTI